MLEKLLSLPNRFGNLAESLKKWYENTPDNRTRIIKSAIMICGIIVLIETLSAATGLIMLYLPRLTSSIIVACLFIPLVVILATPCLLLLERKCKVGVKIKRFNANIWTISMFLSLLLFGINFGIGWFGGKGLTKIPFMIRRLFHTTKTQFPFGGLGGIAVDNENRIYLALHAYERIQVYNCNGEFIHGWFVDADSGIFDIWLEDNTLHVVTARKRKHDVFDYTGNLLRTNIVDSNKEYDTLIKRAAGTKAEDDDGNMYLIESPEWFPKVVKFAPSGEESIIVKDPLHFWLLQKAQPVWTVSFVGMFMCVVLWIIVKLKVNSEIMPAKKFFQPIDGKPEESSF